MENINSAIFVTNNTITDTNQIKLTYITLKLFKFCIYINNIILLNINRF